MTKGGHETLDRSDWYRRPNDGLRVILCWLNGVRNRLTGWSQDPPSLRSARGVTVCGTPTLDAESCAR